MIQKRPGRRMPRLFGCQRRHRHHRPVDRRDTQPALLPRAQHEGDAEDEHQTDDLHRDQRPEQIGRRNAQRGRGPQHRPRPGQEIDAGGHGGHARKDPLVHPEALEQRQHRRNGDEERDRTRAVEMHQQRQERRSHDDPPGTRADAAQDAIDDRVEQAGVGHHAEVEDGEDEHRRHRRGLLQPAHDERPDLPAHAGEQRPRSPARQSARRAATSAGS